MDQLLPGDTDERRISIRTWLAEHPRPTPRQLAHAGYVAPHWPAPWGLAADPIHQLIIDDELARAGVQRPSNAIGIGWAGPTIAYAGSEEQKERYLFPLLTAEEIWCQLFSEPGSGSDLASLSTRAERDGDEWVVNGSKIWTSGAQHSQFGILLARTNPDAAKHKGITYFICPMNLPGIDIRPIREMTGGETFNEVFFTDVRLPLDAVVGEVNDGWRLAKVTLGNERVSLSTGGLLWGHGPTALDLIAQIKRAPVTDPVLRQNIVKVYIEHQILELIRMRTLSARIRGEQPGPEASVRKILADEHGQHVMDLALSLQGAGFRTPPNIESQLGPRVASQSSGRGERGGGFLPPRVRHALAPIPSTLCARSPSLASASSVLWWTLRRWTNLVPACSFWTTPV